MTAKVAVVTGGASGIGRAIVHSLAASGVLVAVADLDADGAAETTATSPDRMRGYTVDISEPESVRRLRADVTADLGTPTILVNAAGWDRMGSFVDADEEFARKITAVNYLGPVFMCQEFLPGMITAGGGRIVNVASDAGRVGSSGETIYAGAKGGVIALTKSVAREVARSEITVNCVCPGPTDTPLFQSFDPKLKAALTKAIPFRRIAQPEEVAAAVAFFASDAASYITGQVLSVSGGLTMAG
ncbi:NAD(P)-dependent dehydrogenase (short-subunit alcohol dehydrogenase family) [Antricoccus suffuscus]|uniref:NAD(P)-dependent dehydrogenase (Short-subunit alcohol dehydrogenase family) n=1 Tax=Antricoccus suffuscus TaxID=1629062 RepID=A0A2T0YZJ1_9ACTN|nr:SDR family oxidoreductase [Antricoccus suffuscus]PRZ29503.1 NAD(P)-dependent dehydrogenase (short-subunit alcohol dehydrogenase family) [Antricoccus suffuscus]